ncbi:helix-turn-helix domain-containing protein [Streptomyces sp. PmtG]
MAHRTVRQAPPPPPGLPDDPRARVPAPSPDCPVEVALAALRGRWTTLVVRELLGGDVYAYSELAAALPQLSDKVLAERLAQLRTAGVVPAHAHTGLAARRHLSTHPARQGAGSGAPGPLGLGRGGPRP